MSYSISQPRYLPAINYIQRLYMCDVFVILDNVQRQGRGVENRNRIMTACGEKWLTIPIASSSREIIKDTKIDGFSWIPHHVNKIKENYKMSGFYNEDLLQKFYAISKKSTFFVDVIMNLLSNMLNLFNLECKFLFASEMDVPRVVGADNLINISKKINDSIYISGANGRFYEISDKMKSINKTVLFHDYQYPKIGNKGEELPLWMCFWDLFFRIGYNSFINEIKKNPVLNIK